MYPFVSVRLGSIGESSSELGESPSASGDSGSAVVKPTFLVRFLVRVLVPDPGVEFVGRRGGREIIGAGMRMGRAFRMKR